MTAHTVVMSSSGSYMLPELLITTVCAVILCKAAPKFFLPEN